MTQKQLNLGPVLQADSSMVTHRGILAWWCLKEQDLGKRESPWLPTIPACPELKFPWEHPQEDDGSMSDKLDILYTSILRGEMLTHSHHWWCSSSSQSSLGIISCCSTGSGPQLDARRAGNTACFHIQKCPKAFKIANSLLFSCHHSNRGLPKNNQQNNSKPLTCHFGISSYSTFWLRN